MGLVCLCPSYDKLLLLLCQPSGFLGEVCDEEEGHKSNEDARNAL